MLQCTCFIFCCSCPHSLKTWVEVQKLIWPTWNNTSMQILDMGRIKDSPICAHAHVGRCFQAEAWRTSMCVELPKLANVSTPFFSFYQTFAVRTSWFHKVSCHVSIGHIPYPTWSSRSAKKHARTSPRRPENSLALEPPYQKCVRKN